MLAQDERAQAGDVRRCEAVAGCGDRLAAEPRYLDVQAAREELDRRARVCVKDEGIRVLVAADRDDACEPPREALHGHVVCGGDEHRPFEVRDVGELVQPLAVPPFRRRQAHVDDVETLLDRPLEPGEEDRRAAGVAGAEDANARELALRREQANDPRARGAVSAEISSIVVSDRDLVAFLCDGDGALDRPTLG